MVAQRLPSSARQAFDNKNKQDMLAYSLIFIGLLLELKIGLTTSDKNTMQAVVGLVAIQSLWPLHHFFPKFIETCLHIRRDTREEVDSQV